MEIGSVDILGLTEEWELSSISLPYLKHFNDRDYITISKDEEGIYAIAKVEMSLSITSQREVFLPDEKLLFLDGEKSVILGYTSEEGSFIKNAFTLPFSCLLPLDKEMLPETIKLYPIHIYSYLFSANTIIIHTHYVATVTFNEKSNNEFETIGLLNSDEESLNEKTNNEFETIVLLNPDEESL